MAHNKLSHQWETPLFHGDQYETPNTGRARSMAVGDQFLTSGSNVAMMHLLREHGSHLFHPNAVEAAYSYLWPFAQNIAYGNGNNNETGYGGGVVPLQRSIDQPTFWAFGGTGYLGNGNYGPQIGNCSIHPDGTTVHVNEEPTIRQLCKGLCPTPAADALKDIGSDNTGAKGPPKGGDQSPQTGSYSTYQDKSAHSVNEEPNICRPYSGACTAPSTNAHGDIRYGSNGAKGPPKERDHSPETRSYSTYADETTHHINEEANICRSCNGTPSANSLSDIKSDNNGGGGSSGEDDLSEHDSPSADKKSESQGPHPIGRRYTAEEDAWIIDYVQKHAPEKGFRKKTVWHKGAAAYYKKFQIRRNPYSLYSHCLSLTKKMHGRSVPGKALSKGTMSTLTLPMGMAGCTEIQNFKTGHFSDEEAMWIHGNVPRFRGQSGRFKWGRVQLAFASEFGHTRSIRCLTGKWVSMEKIKKTTVSRALMVAENTCMQGKATL